MNEGIKLYCINDLCEIYNVSRVTLWDWENKEIIPKPIVLPNGRKRWSAESIEEHLNGLAEAS